MKLKPWKAAKAIPVAKLVAAAKVAMLARRHWLRLEPTERQRMVTLVRTAGVRRGRLTSNEWMELGQLVAKADPRGFAGLVAERFSPVPLPRRVVKGKRR